MQSLEESVQFKELVSMVFDNKEYVRNWERLRGKRLLSEKSMKLFIKDVRDLFWDRLPRNA